MENKISSLIKNKVAFDNRRRIIALVGSALLIVGGVASTFFATKTKVDTEEDVYIAMILLRIRSIRYILRKMRFTRVSSLQKEVCIPEN